MQINIISIWLSKTKKHTHKNKGPHPVNYIGEFLQVIPNGSNMPIQSLCNMPSVVFISIISFCRPLVKNVELPGQKDAAADQECRQEVPGFFKTDFFWPK